VDVVSANEFPDQSCNAALGPENDPGICQIAPHYRVQQRVVLCPDQLTVANRLVNNSTACSRGGHNFADVKASVEPCSRWAVSGYALVATHPPAPTCMYTGCHFILLWRQLRHSAVGQAPRLNKICGVHALMQC